jgi:hypothetical protein
MPAEWFILPEQGQGTSEDPYRPDLFGYDLDRFAGNYPGGDVRRNRYRRT